MMQIQDCERNGEKFDLDVFLAARKRCIQSTEAVISKIQSGMTEGDIKNLITEEFKTIGCEKFWHPIKIRIGSDTTKSFRELSDPDKVTQTGEICFLDLGPVIQDHEGDYGRTFLVNSSKTNKIIDACHEVFSQTAKVWKEKRLSGVELFQYAQKLSLELGFELNPFMSGHRLGDFPHKIFSSQSLFKFDSLPSKNLWVLEIHLVDRNKQVGAFFEDVLL